jgi:hypothetical protein
MLKNEAEITGIEEEEKREREKEVVEEEEAGLTTHSRFNYSARVNTYIDTI